MARLCLFAAALVMGMGEEAKLEHMEPQWKLHHSGGCQTGPSDTLHVASRVFSYYDPSCSGFRSSFWASNSNNCINRKANDPWANKANVGTLNWCQERCDAEPTCQGITIALGHVGFSFDRLGACDGFGTPSPCTNPQGRCYADGRDKTNELSCAVYSKLTTTTTTTTITTTIATNNTTTATTDIATTTTTAIAATATTINITAIATTTSLAITDTNTTNRSNTPFGGEKEHGGVVGGVVASILVLAGVGIALAMWRRRQGSSICSWIGRWGQASNRAQQAAFELEEAVRNTVDMESNPLASPRAALRANAGERDHDAEGNNEDAGTNNTDVYYSSIAETQLDADGYVVDDSSPPPAAVGEAMYATYATSEGTPNYAEPATDAANYAEPAAGAPEYDVPLQHGGVAYATNVSGSGTPAVGVYANANDTSTSSV